MIVLCFMLAVGLLGSLPIAIVLACSMRAPSSSSRGVSVEELLQQEVQQ